MGMTLMSNPKGSVATVIVSQAGDGDTTDIQTGINLLPATGGVVYIKEGTYRLTEEISITTNNVSLIGAGYSTRIVVAATARGIQITSADYITISNARLDGVDQACNQRLLDLDDANNIEITSCWFEGIAIGGNVLISVGLDVGGDCTKIRIVSNDLNQGFTGISIDKSEEVIVTSNIIYSAESGGVSITSSTLILNSGNEINGHGGVGVFLSGVTNSIINGNIIHNNTTYGLRLFATCDNNIVTSNRCEDNATAEIDIANANCDNNIIIGNQCVGTHVNAITDAGTGTEVGHNITT